MWLLGHPFAALVGQQVVAGGMMGCAESGRSGSIRTRDLAAESGGHDLHDLATDRRPWAAVSCRLPGWVLQGADVAVAQRVEDVLDLLPGRGDRADVGAAPVGDPVPERADPGVRADQLGPTPPRPSGPAGSPAW